MGKPLIAWTIESAKKCAYIDKTIVSTDDQEIASISTCFGAIVPFVRPADLASDTATSFSVVKHAALFLQKKNNEKYDFAVLLQPTSPLRDSDDIRKAIELLESKQADSVVSVCEVEHSPLWMNTLPADHSFAGFILKSIDGKRSQDLPTYYRLNGAIYISKIERMLSEGKLYFNTKSFAYIMSREKSIDIDSGLDFTIAEAICSTMIKSIH